MENISEETLLGIARVVQKYLNGKIQGNTNPDFTSFGHYSRELENHVSVSYYPDYEKFQGNLNNIGHFSGFVQNNSITVIWTDGAYRATLYI